MSSKISFQKQAKKSLNEADQTKTTHNRSLSGNRTCIGSALEKKVYLNSHFTPNGIVSKSHSAWRDQYSLAKPSSIEIQKSLIQNKKKGSSDLRQILFANSNCVPKKSAGSFATQCLNSTLTKGMRDFSNSKNEKKFNTYSRTRTDKDLSSNQPTNKNNVSFASKPWKKSVTDHMIKVDAINSPLGMFNSKKMSAKFCSNPRKSQSNFDDGVAFLRNMKPMSRNLKKFFGKTKLNEKMSTENLTPNIESTLIKNRSKASPSKSVMRLVDGIMNLKEKKNDKGSQKNFSLYYKVNFSSTNINSLLRDIAKNKLLIRYMNKEVKDESRPETMKGKIIKECISMAQEQLFFEELLQLLGERGVEVESLFDFCYERLKITNSMQNSSTRTSDFRIFTETNSIMNSEITVLDNASLMLKNQDKPSAKKRFLKLNFDNVQQEILTSSETN